MTWTADELRAHAEGLIRRHEQLLATYPRLQPGDSATAAVARAYLGAVGRVGELERQIEQERVESYKACATADTLARE